MYHTQIHGRTIGIAHSYLADKHGRSPLIAAGGALSVVAAVVTAYVVWVAAEEDAAGKGPPKWAMITLAGCMVAWGISGGIVSGPAQALYADSIPHGERSKWCATVSIFNCHAVLLHTCISFSVTVVRLLGMIASRMCSALV